MTTLSFFLFFVFFFPFASILRNYLHLITIGGIIIIINYYYYYFFYNRDLGLGVFFSV